MFVKAIGSGRRGLESGEDQIPTDVRNVIQAPKSDLMARGVAIDLLQVAKRVGLQREAAEHEDLSGEEGFSLDSVIVDDWRGHRTFWGWHSGTLNESTNVGVKTGRSRVGGPELCVEDRW